ncbi:hypothetical protein AgCh_002636 [Apium graveolens]
MSGYISPPRSWARSGYRSSPRSWAGKALILEKHTSKLVVSLFYSSTIAILSALLSLIVEKDLSSWSLQSNVRIMAVIYARDTINIVDVTHSISKDMKLDLGSLRYVAACAAVSRVLAQRALAENIHNVVYTPRRVEKLEVRIWGVNEKRVVDWAYVRDVITEICYHPNGNNLAVGSLSGTCHFYDASGNDLLLAAEFQVK